jgi:hypothetical protein
MSGPAACLWTEVVETLRGAHSPLTERWVYGGSKYGWSCRLERGKKGILYLTPDVGHIRMGMALSDAARDAVMAAEVPAQVRQALAVATRAPEGWPVRLPIRSAEDVALTLRLAEIKLSC